MKFFVKTVSCTPHATMSQSLMYAMYYYVHCTRGVSGGWAEWAIAHPDFGRLEGAAGQQGRAALLLAHPDLGSYL